MGAATIAELVIAILSKGIPAVMEMIQSSQEMSAEEKAALKKRLSDTLEEKRLEVAGVVILDPTDPANLPDSGNA